MITSESINEIAKALTVCQANMVHAKKDATNPHFKSQYADLASIMEAAKEAMTKAGLALTFNIANTDDGVSLTPMLLHNSGQYFEYDAFNIPVTQKTAQGQGSAITYGRRYLYQSIIGIASEDDDGNEASKVSHEKKSEVIKPESRNATPSKAEPKAEQKLESKPESQEKSPEQIEQETAYKDDRRMILGQLVEIFGPKDNPNWTDADKATINSLETLKEADAKHDIDLLKRLHVLALIGQKLKVEKTFEAIKPLLDLPTKGLEDYLLDMTARQPAEQPEIF